MVDGGEVRVVGVNTSLRQGECVLFLQVGRCCLFQGECIVFFHATAVYLSDERSVKRRIFLLSWVAASEKVGRAQAKSSRLGMCSQKF